MTLDQEALNLLKELTESFGPAGFEREPVTIARSQTRIRLIAQLENIVACVVPQPQDKLGRGLQRKKLGRLGGIVPTQSSAEKQSCSRYSESRQDSNSNHLSTHRYITFPPKHASILKRDYSRVR
jgi:hypothetical protein